MKKLLGGLVVLLALGLPAATMQTASASPSPASAGKRIHVLAPPSRVHTHAVAATGSVYPYTYGTPPLVYDNSGAATPQIMKAVKTYRIYWNPGQLQDGTPTTIPTNYKNLIKRFFTDFSGSGLAQNNTQYYGYSKSKANVHISSTTSVGGSWTWTAPFPTGHCSTSHTGTNCVDDADIAAVAAAAAAAHGVSAGTNKMFFVYTPFGEGSCFGSGACADNNATYTGYCAYHSYTTATFGTQPTLVYANQPWPTDPSGWNCYGATGQTYPNGDTNADASINVTSHELIEAQTDPMLDNWYDNSGYEIGDECAWEFGSVTTGGGDVNWNGHPYSVQPEASNSASGCVFDGP